MAQLFKMPKIDWSAINEKLPYERTEEAKEKRKKLFAQFDPNGNGYLSLAEVWKSDKWPIVVIPVRKKLGLIVFHCRWTGE